MNEDSTIDKDRTVVEKKSGTHRLGTGFGTAEGAAAGTAVGAAVGASVGGPPGAAVGAAVGAVAGGLAGRGIVAAIDPILEDTYWHENFTTRPYVSKDRPYDYYRDAYRYGWESRASRPGSRWEDVESDLERGWDKTTASSRLAWGEAKSATRDAWHRIERKLPGDADKDGR
jgi:hypothetical protein